MTARHPSLSAARRPSSAIFIGLPPSPSPPSPARSSSSTHSQLPSPPATNSGSTGDSNSTSAGSVRRTGMPNGNKRSSSSDGSDDNLLEHDEDNTAKFSNDKRAGKGKDVDRNASSSTLQRVKSLTERNRKVIDKLSSMTSPDSHSRSPLATPPAPSSTSSSRSRSPHRPNFSSSSSSTASISSRVSFSLSPRGGSGSETEREQRHPERLRPASRDTHPTASNGSDASIPPASTRPRSPVLDGSVPRQRLRSAPSSPAKPPPTLAQNSPRKHASTSFTVVGGGRRSRRVSIQQPVGEDEDPPETPQTGGGSTSKRSRAPLPREFRDRRSIDGRSVGESSSSTRLTPDNERTISPGILVARGAASPHSSGAGGTFSTTPTSPRAQRPARASTVRDSMRRVQRWGSVDEVTTTGNENSPVGEDGDGRRQFRNAGSAESPLGVREARSVVGEGLRAAGLARRGAEDLFADVPQRRNRLSGGLGSRLSLNGSKDGRDLDDLREGITRAGLGLPEEGRDPRTSPGSGRYSTARNIHSVISNNPSRPGTSLASYGVDKEDPHSAPPLRSYRSPYMPQERPATRHTPQHDLAHTSPYARSSPHLQTPSTEHARLMLESLAMFETQLARIPSSSSAPDLSRVAHSVVQSANGLNTLLRAGNAHALESQIEAEVGDAPAQVDSSEVWRQVGGEYRESLRVSDELVRTVTALLLGVARVVREAVKERGTESPDAGGGERSRPSLDGSERSLRTSRRSMEVDGRRSVEGHTSRESWRSWEDTEGTMRRPRVDSRPSTSLSMTRERDQGLSKDSDGDQSSQERDRSSTLGRLSLRRMFTPRSRDTLPASRASQGSPDLTLPSPSPAPRGSLERDRNEHHRSLPPLTVPPPLPSLPSESLDRKGSARRRSKFSNTSNATVRGTSIFPAINSPNPTTALSTQTVSAAGEVTAFPLLRADVSSATALSGLQQQQERDARKRTTSATSVDGVSGSSGSTNATTARVLRNSRARMSLDGGALESTSQDHLPSPAQPSAANGARRERRRTITDGLPS